ncbi:MAG: ATP-dependent RNA helicase HrpA [Zetaproteobacteria bacterium CG12_big_fil_rev_8_21_14_0_65_54_13]|nr:MAG: ATP-dependent RNA helicase HrpA [Zetaproteobacteria bacterium CG12_big_fil_rev_8_21_14_0_65_54_13]PIX53672.1 MAG: ATP-dependent RNA helicase HrpA [Zetaproteobacteria bacterium CG_4_10_14_3_um_filter_54_28]PJA27151.1 MAG: ATP-dependent RNA helicase HrpA [Zetaproteobacteria bacterium CG_4_9_14_3_um_filter_54_145]
MNAHLQTIDDLLGRLTQCMLADRRTLSKRLHGLRRRLQQNKPVDRALATLADEITASENCCTQRRLSCPLISYPEELPVSAKRQLISLAIAKHQVVIIAGETGSGKTTQIPKICLELGRGIAGLIGHTQPRRIAARSVAGRIAEELNSKIGEHVGYKVRFSDHTGKQAYIKLMTDGILLAEIQSDPLLLAYDTIIIDEAHERSLNIDFLLGYFRQLLPRRRDLKLIITSATINTARFAQFFDNAPVIEVSGRSYPVDVRYRPVQGDDDDDRDRDLPQAIIDAVDEAAGIDPLGDILLFLPGEREIREISDALHQHKMRDTEVIPLLSRLSPAEQDKVFQQHTGRRIVLATNVAETSLTVPGIRFVIDSGLARISRYSTRTKVQRLPIEPISQASANQRAGRCGRIAAGICIRLYSEESFNNRSEQTDPEIRRTNLASVILQMSNLGLGEVADFPFMDAPEKLAVRDGYMLLDELQAVDGNRQLTPIGKKLVRLPLDPRIGRMLLQAQSESCLQELLIIASALSVQDPRTRPMEMQQQADEKHRLFADPASDFLAWIKLWNWYHEQARRLSRSKLRKLCHDRFLSYIRLREWHDLHSQLLAVVREMKMTPNREPAAVDAIHRALLAGLLSHIGLYDDEKKQYMGARNLRFSLFPGSALFKKPPKWVVCAELVETSRLFGRSAAVIDPAWLEALAPHLIKRSYSEPHWSRKRAQVTAIEKLSLYGLPVIGNRHIDFGAVDPAVSRELFIRHALVLDEFHTHAKAITHNRRLISELEKLEAKQRRRDLLAEEQAIFDFFDAVIPEHVCSGKSFEHWRMQAEQKQPKLLYLRQQDLLHSDASTVDAGAFPDAFHDGKLKLKYRYHFDPAHKADGITLLVPLQVLGQLDAARFDWLVPGMLQEKLALLIKSLPKAMRRHFVPAPEFARAAAGNMTFGSGDLLTAFARELGRMTGVTPHHTEWQTENLPAYMSMQFCLLDEQGKTVTSSRDLRALQHQYAAHSRRSLQAVDKVQQLEKQGITRWDFGELPELISSRRGSMQLQLFPALQDDGGSVSIRVFESRHEAELTHRKGLLRLIQLHLHQQVQMLKQSTPQLQQMSLRYALISDPSSLKEDLVEAVFAELFMHEPLPRSAAAFQSRLDQGRSHIVAQAAALAGHVTAALIAHTDLSAALAGSRAAPLKPVVDDIREQMSRLIYPGFVAVTPARWLVHYPRYIQAAGIRLDKAGRNLRQDQLNRENLARLWSQYAARREELLHLRADTDAVDLFRWQLEELRVSLFAQELKTSIPVSLKKLETLWQSLR